MIQASELPRTRSRSGSPLQFRLRLALVMGFLLWGTACAAPADTPSSEDAPRTPSIASAAVGLSLEQETFWARLSQLCGMAFPGRLHMAPDDDDWWDAEAIVMHVRECSDQEIRIPLHIDDNRSRTWVVTRTESGLRLKHDHRIRDGSPDLSNTEYGGDTTVSGSIWRQEFPADAYSVGVVPERASQLWFLEIRPDDAFVYGLRREATGLRYHVEFDLTPLPELPPAPWGS